MKIIPFPHPTLRHKSKAIRRVDPALKKIVREMFDLMYAAKGVGLAANQVDLPIRLFIANLEADPGRGQELVFINPVVTNPKGSEEQEEGCLSLPGLYGNVVRPKQVRIAAYDLSGNEIDTTATGLLARVIQHELDHLDGVLFIDRMDRVAQSTLQDTLDEFITAFDSRRGTGEVPADREIFDRLAEWEQRYC